jgi:hypothetical protein
MEALVEVGYCEGRPVVPDERWTLVRAWAVDEVDARLLACQVVAARVEMVTSAAIVELVL